MSATDELCRLLDERGVEWWREIFRPNDISRETSDSLVWENGDALYIAQDSEDERLRLAIQILGDMTPERAIEMTVGKTTTRNGKTRKRYGRDVPLCECCGYAIGDVRYKWCPNCGARIVE